MSRREAAANTARLSKQVRVGFITPSLGGGGAERWVLSLVAAFSRRIKTAGILTPDPAGELSEEAAKLTTIFPLSKTADFLRTCDVIIAWGWEQLADTLKGFTGKVIGVSHGAPDLEWTRRINAGMAKQPNLCKAAVSASAAESWGPDSTPVVISNGADPNRCCPRSSRNEIRMQFGIPAGAKVALYSGRFSAEKRPQLLAQAVQHLPHDWLAVFCGKECGIPAADLEGPRCKVLPFQDVPADMLEMADVFVLPSETEGHPIALTEAWLAGTPSVYCRWGFAEEIEDRHHGPLGVVVPVNVCPVQLAHAIALARSMPQEQLEDIRRTAWTNYTAPRMAAQWEKLILSQF